jgi:hypothetical protein
MAGAADSGRAGPMGPSEPRVPAAVRLPASEKDAAEGAADLRQAVAHFQAFRGPFDEHPMLGPLTPEQWTRFHCIHCAHHLSFALPSDQPH